MDDITVLVGKGGAVEGSLEQRDQCLASAPSRRSRRDGMLVAPKPEQAKFSI